MKPWLIHIAAAGLLALSACADAATSWTVTFQSDETQLVSDGIDKAEFFIAVIDNQGLPVEVGTSLPVICIDAEAQPYGDLGGLTEGIGNARADNVGAANLNFHCIRDVPTQVVCLVEYAGEQALTALECTAREDAP